jgi:predicted dehydrogenase
MVRIGMLGCGFLATFYMQGLSEVPNQQVVVVYGRDRSGRALQADLCG